MLLAEIAHHTKTAFYIGGGALAVWAVILAAIGLSRPSFPQNDGLGRGVLALSLVLMLGAMSTAVATS